MHFGERLQYLRNEKLLTQKDLATELGMTAGMISSYEREISFPKLNQFKKICDYFDVTPLYFMCYTNIPSPIEKGDNIITLPDDLNVNEAMLEDIFNYIRFLSHIEKG